MREIDRIVQAGARVISAYTGDNQENSEKIADECFAAMLSELIRLADTHGLSAPGFVLAFVNQWHRDHGPDDARASGASNPH